MKKKISIIIATYNASSTLKRCLISITSQLTDECELIIVDGGSKDSTNKIILSFGEKVNYYLSEPDKGIYDAWNKGVKEAKGDWVMFIGADDILLPNAISSYIDCLSENDKYDYDYICANNEYVDKRGKLLMILGCNAVWKKMRRMMCAAHVASLHNRKTLFETIGGYNLDYRICADYELLLRKGKTLKSFFIPNHIARMEVGGMSFTMAAIKEVYAIRKLHKSVPALANYILFVRDVAGYEFFKIRNSLRGRVLK